MIATSAPSLLAIVYRLPLRLAILTSRFSVTVYSLLLSSRATLLESLTLFPLRLVNSLTTIPISLLHSSPMIATATRPLS